MRNIIIAIMLIVLVSGCNGGSSKKSESSKKKESTPVGNGSMYKGQHVGCLAQYDELFCPKKYAKGILNAGEEPEYIADENGTIILLEKNATTNKGVYTKMPHKDK